MTHNTANCACGCLIFHSPCDPRIHASKQLPPAIKLQYRPSRFQKGICAFCFQSRQLLLRRGLECDTYKILSVLTFAEPPKSILSSHVDADDNAGDDQLAG